MRDIAVIMPTVREPEAIVEYHENALSHKFPTERLFYLLVTEDFVDKAKIRDLLKGHGMVGEVLGQTERDGWFHDRALDNFSHLIPRRSHAETSFGLLWMQAERALTTGIFLDDDTRPLPEVDFFRGHLGNLEFEGALPEVRSDKQWVNVLYHTYARHGLYPRGYPYAQMGETTKVGEAHISRGEVVLSQGLWTNVPDLDAVRILAQGEVQGQSRVRLTPLDYGGLFTIPTGMYTTVCSMNLAFRREIIPAFYQLPMDDNPWKIGRFDDIWSGVIAKRVLDTRGRRLVNGTPLAAHNKYPRSTFKDLVAEGPALEPNETLYRELQSVDITSAAKDGGYEAATRLLARAMQEPRCSEFLKYVGKFTEEWLELLRKLG